VSSLDPARLVDVIAERRSFDAEPVQAGPDATFARFPFKSQLI
jgi:hypothetical protein